jgi:uncharacterized protein (TIGR02757 family)
MGLASSASPLFQALDRLYHDYNEPASAADPVHIVRRYARNEDREVVGLCAASLAFGRVASVLQSIEALLVCMGPRPAAFVRAFDPRRDGDALRGVGHRWTRTADVAALLWIARQMIEQAGSIEAFFAAGDEVRHPDVEPGLESFSARALGCDLREAYGRVPRRPGVCFFFPRPSAGSACKRLNLFLRWMARRDRIDLGVWRAVSPSRLIVPLDTHVIRLGRCLGLTHYRSPGWRMAAEITAALRALDPEDPVKFDFALCHVGMHGRCGFGRRGGDRACPLRGLCRPSAVAPRAGAGQE